MSFPAYPRYRDSGRQWLGKLPEDWRLVPFWTLFRRVKRTDYPEEELLSVYRDHGVIRKGDRDDNFNKPSEDLGPYQLVEPGDLAINKMKAWQGSLGISPYRGIVSPAYFVYRARHEELSGYLHYLLRSDPYATGFMTISKGIRINQWDLDPDHLAQLPVPLPSLSEQAAIAAFLDRETAKIDALVEEQRWLIELLKEKRQAVISHAVTKGLDPTVPMKDSGVEWLGKVPAHWEVKRLRFLCKIGTGDADTADAVGGGAYPFFVRSPVVERIDRYTHDCEAVLTAGDGAGVGKVYHHFQGQFCAHQRVYIFSDFDGVLGRFLYFYMSEMFAKIVLEGTAKSTVESLRRPMIADFCMTVPPEEEQRGIVGAVEQATAQLDALTVEAESAINLLQERRSALISAAVTGKIDARDAAKVVPFPVDRARARGLVAAEIIERSAHQATFGRVKLQKIAFLAEAHVGIDELAGSYTREAAGPLDRLLIAEMESGARSVAGVEVDQSGGAGTAVCYRLGQLPGAYRQELVDWLGAERATKLDKLIADFADLTTKGAEAVATLYGVWNDALIEGASPTDDEIISGFLDDWHPEKREKFRANELTTWLSWMRRHGVVPSGSGPKTNAGRLL